MILEQCKTVGRPNHKGNICDLDTSIELAETKDLELSRYEQFTYTRQMDDEQKIGPKYFFENMTSRKTVKVTQHSGSAV